MFDLLIIIIGFTRSGGFWIGLSSAALQVGRWLREGMGQATGVLAKAAGMP